MSDIKEKIAASAALETAPDPNRYKFWCYDEEEDAMVQIPIDLLPAVLAATLGAPVTDAGAVPYGDGSDLTADVAKLIFDSANKMLGIGTASPAAGVHVVRDTSSDATPEHLRLGSSNAAPVASISFENNAGVIYLRINGGSAAAGVKSRTLYTITTNVTNSNGTGGNECVRADSAGNVRVGLAPGSGSTAGFAYVPAMAGVPSGAPAQSYTGFVPIVFNTTDKKIYAYFGGAWVSHS